MFGTYFGFGFTHLLDIRAYDHLLFLGVLCGGCGHDRPRELLALVTAFTAGHSASLALATLQLVRVPSDWVEFLIMVTIVAGAALNLAPRTSGSRAPDSRAAAPRQTPARGLIYATTVLFGLVHGLGFSNFLKTALGSERSLLVPLLSFNLGLEAAQIAAVAVFSLLAFVAVRMLGAPSRAWATGLSVVAGAIAMVAAARRWPL